MTFHPVLALHIAGGSVGFLSGCVTVFLRKGSRRHAIAGDVFVVSMLTLALTGVLMAIMKSQPPNILGGSLTFYLVATGWMTARRKLTYAPAIFDWAALSIVLTIAAFEFVYGYQAANSPKGHRYGYPPGPFLMFGFIALLAIVGDIRVIARRSITGTQRLVRHLWRMNFAWFIAAASIFLARPHLFPVILQKTGVLVFLSFLPLIMLVFWMARVKLTNAFRKSPPKYPSLETGPGISKHASTV